MKPPFEHDELGATYAETFDAEGVPRPQYQALHEWLHELSVDELRRREGAAEKSFLHQGITFGDALIADEGLLLVTRRGTEPHRAGEQPMQQQ